MTVTRSPLDAPDAVRRGAGRTTAVAVARRRLLPYLYLLPLLVVLLLGFVWPVLRSVLTSFHPFSPVEGADFTEWTLGNYREIVTSSLYGSVFLRTLRISLIVCLLSALVAYPVALFGARLGSTARKLLILLYVGPWLVNVAVKAFGWTLLLRSEGPVNDALLWVGVTAEPLELLFNEAAVIIGLFHAHLMFVVLPLLFSVSGISPGLLDAAANLGAGRVRRFVRIVLPLTAPALVAGTVMNFILCMGAFATPALLGGNQAPVVSYVVYGVNLLELNEPLGAAMTISLLVLTLGIVFVFQSLMRIGPSRRWRP